MTLPPLYKYLDLEGAKLTLGNGTFRHAKPSDFNDGMDMTIENMFPEEIETVLKKLVKIGVARIIFENIDNPPTCFSAEHRSKVSQMQDAFRNNPEFVEIIEKELKADQVGDVYNVEYMRKLVENTIVELNEFLQGYRVLCVTDDNASVQMWERYANDHRGIVLRITPNKEKDSKFSLFRKVNYQ